MSDFRRHLPPLGTLVIFEAAARRMSFTRAAEEIGITQAAVSRQIQSLERSLGFPVFRRKHRGIELTERGRMLSRTMSDALGRISETVETITERSQSAELVIASTVAFSHFWLLPRISGFRRAYPDIRLKLVAQDGWVDLMRGEADVAIRYGDGHWPDGKVVALFGEAVYPVCSPEYLARCGTPECVADLAQHGLIAAHPQERSWLDWDQWFAAFGLGGTRHNVSMTCSFYTDAVNAAVCGEGIALGWHRLVDDLLRTNQLVRVTPESLQTRATYHLVLRGEPQRGAVVSTFQHWMRSVSARLPPLGSLSVPP
jgi:DNA-binding transcriptional LysR family regulator